MGLDKLYLNGFFCVYLLIHFLTYETSHIYNKSTQNCGVPRKAGIGTEWFLACKILTLSPRPVIGKLFPIQKNYNKPNKKPIQLFSRFALSNKFSDLFLYHRRLYTHKEANIPNSSITHKNSTNHVP